MRPCDSERPDLQGFLRRHQTTLVGMKNRRYGEAAKRQTYESLREEWLSENLPNYLDQPATLAKHYANLSRRLGVALGL